MRAGAGIAFNHVAARYVVTRHSVKAPPSGLQVRPALRPARHRSRANSASARSRSLARNERERVEHMRELLARQLIDGRHVRVHAGPQVCVVAAGEQPRRRREAPNRAGQSCSTGIGSCSTMAVVTCVVTRSLTRKFTTRLLNRPQSMCCARDASGCAGRTPCAWMPSAPGASRQSASRGCVALDTSR